MRGEIRRLAMALLLLTAAVSAEAQSSRTANSGASARIATGVAIRKTQDLDFGTIISPAAAGIVTIAPNGTRTSTLTFGPATHTVASFDLTWSSGPLWLPTISVPPSVTLTSGGNTMVVNNFTYTLTLERFWPLPVVTRLDVGGRLNVAANQAAGVYSGTFMITAVED